MKLVKDLLLDVIVIAAGIAVGVGIFSVIQRTNSNKQRNELIPQAEAAVKNQNYSLAINLYQKAELEFPENQNVKKEIANLYFQKGKYQEAVNYYERISQNNLKPEDYNKFGEAYLNLNNKEKAIKTWENKQLEPKNIYKLSKLYYENGQLDNQQNELKKIVNTQEGFILAQVIEQDLSKILNTSSQAINLPKISEDKLNINTFISQIENAYSQLQANKTDYSELIQIAAFADLNQCRYLSDRINSLRETLVSKKIPTDQLDYYEGICSNEINQPQKAISLLESAINSDTTIIEYREALAESYFLLNNPDKIKEIYNEVFVIKNDYIYHLNLGFYLAKLNLIDESINQYNQALNSSPEENRPNIAFTLAQINLLDKKNLEFCRNEASLNYLSQLSNNSEAKIITLHCDIYNKKYSSDKAPNIITEYFDALSEKNFEKLNIILDKDLEGIISSYYRAIGGSL